MSAIKLEFQTNNKETIDLCKLYWKINENHKFIHKISELAGKFNFSKSLQITEKVKQSCRGYSGDYLCINCNQPVGYFTSRAEYIGGSWKWNYEGLCSQCEEKQKQKEEKEKEKEEKIQRAEKLEKMQIAFENGIYESLNNLEFNFLIVLSTSEHTEKARKKIGLSAKDAMSIIDKFIKLNLINETEKGYEFLPKLKEALQKISLLRRVKSIFTSPKSLKLYRKLKQEYLFVYPEIPLCAFVEKEQIEHLFTKSWHGRYFLTCRIDFIICDHDGKPIFAVEYQGGYHESTQQREKDIFKEKILNEVGLPLRKFTSKELYNSNPI